jgi:hypothetical protein
VHVLTNRHSTIRPHSPEAPGVSRGEDFLFPTPRLAFRADCGIAHLASVQVEMRPEEKINSCHALTAIGSRPCLPQPNPLSLNGLAL